MKLIPDDPIVACMMRTGYPPWIRTDFEDPYEEETEEEQEDEDVPCSGHAAGVLGLYHAHRGGLAVAHAGDARLTACEIDAHHLVARIGQQAHRAAAAGLRVVGMRPYGQYLQAFARFG